MVWTHEMCRHSSLHGRAQILMSWLLLPFRCNQVCATLWSYTPHLAVRSAARTFKIIDPKTRHPATAEWERAFQIFDLLL